MLKRLLLLGLLFFSSLHAYTSIDEEPPLYTPLSDASQMPTAGDFEGENETTPSEKEIYVTIEKLPKKIYVNQLFPVTIKITSLRKHVPYTVKVEGGENVEAIRSEIVSHPRSINHLTLYFKALAPKMRLPQIVVKYEDSPREYRTQGTPLSAIRLNPPRDFCGLVAKNLKLENYQASAYDKNGSILALQLRIAYGNVEDFHLSKAIKQGIDSIIGDLNATTLLYYAVFPSKLEEVTFSYFNFSTNRYERFQVPIIVKRTSVSTQTELDPQASEFTKFKIAATGVLILFWLFLWWRSKKWRYFLYIVAATAYLLTYLIPLKNVCLKKGATVYLLPTLQSTPFLKLSEKSSAKEMEKKSNYTKVQLSNNHIGWVKNEDLCTY